MAGQRSLAVGSPAVSGFARARLSKVARLLSLAFAGRFSVSVPSSANRRHSSSTGAAFAAYSTPRSLGLATPTAYALRSRERVASGGVDPEDFTARTLVVHHIMVGHVLKAFVQQRLSNSVAQRLPNLVSGHGHRLSPQDLFNGLQGGHGWTPVRYDGRGRRHRGRVGNSSISVHCLMESLPSADGPAGCWST